MLITFEISFDPDRIQTDSVSERFVFFIILKISADDKKVIKITQSAVLITIN